jgi:hypothetical protein
VSKRVSASTFTPDAEGWTVGDMRGMGGGDLLSGFDLGDTAPRFSMRPLLDLAACVLRGGSVGSRRVRSSDRPVGRRCWGG